MKRLCDALLEYEKAGNYPCHMPGRKGSREYSFLGDILKYDITETDGMDNLHDAKGVILSSEKFAASVYGSEETHFLVNGSTSGVLCAILGSTDEGDRILVARNCHISVYNATVLNRLEVSYVYPEPVKEHILYGSVTPEAVLEAFKADKDIRAVVITSPTYEGIVSDIKSIAGICHDHDAVLIVDSAHGAHFGFSDDLPDSPVRQGADIVIHGIHKTLPSPTQTALIHLNGSRVDRDGVRRMLKMIQSSSPSYLLMAGIDNCMSILNDHGDDLFAELSRNLDLFTEEISKLSFIRHISREILSGYPEVYEVDPSKILLSAADAGLSGQSLYDLLRKEYRIMPEMACAAYCLLIMSIMDKKEGFDRIKNALKCIDEKILENKPDISYRNIDGIFDIRPVQLDPIYSAVRIQGEKEDIKRAAGMISAGYIYLYPPGIPLIVPGEEIKDDLIECILAYQDMGMNIQGLTEDGKTEVYEKDILHNR
jgi:arginine/lysine/ornithine decarboxylase